MGFQRCQESILVPRQKGSSVVLHRLTPTDQHWISVDETLGCSIGRSL